MNVDIFIPCFVDQLYPATAFNMVKVLEKAGCAVNYNPKQTCCGQPAFNAGFVKDAAAVAQYFQDTFCDAEQIVSPSASCTGFINNYQPTILKTDGSKKLATAKEFSQFLVNDLEQTNFNAVFPHKVTYHDSCAGLRECGIKKEPRLLLQNVEGLELVEMHDNETCCGFGGTFAMKFASISVAMSEQKIQNALDSGAEYIVSTDLSCLMQIQSVIDKQGLKMKTIHLADLLASGW